MIRVLKYLGEFKAAVAAIILLLILQAYCDLALPQYTADIVDVGIGQGGVERAVPVRMSEGTMRAVCMLLDQEAARAVEASYERTEDGIYILRAVEEEDLDSLEGLLAEPLAFMMFSNGSMMENGVDGENAMITHDGTDPAAVMEKGMEEMDESMLSQMAIASVQAEYERLGMDMEEIRTEYLLRKGGRMLLFALVMMASAIGTGFLAARVSAAIGERLRKRMFERVVSFSAAEMDRFSTASLITRSTNDIQQIQMVSVMLLRMVLYAPIVGVGGVIKVAGTQTGMGWIIVVAVAAILLLVGVLMLAAMPRFKKMQTLVDGLNLVAREILTGLPVIRAFGREETEEQRFAGASRDLMQNQLFTGRVMTVMMPAMMLIMNLVSVMILWFGAEGIDLGRLQVGDMLAFITYTMQIVISFLMLTMISVMLPRAGVAAERIEETLRVESSVRDREGAGEEAFTEGAGEVCFEHVSFCYPEAGENVLEDISFTAKPGETTAIIGSTGCGKSTLVGLIPRLYDVTEGRITIDHMDIRDLSLHRLRGMIGYVPQKSVLFSGTIASNLQFGGEHIMDEAMQEAAEIAQAMEFIDSKAGRFDTEIAQGGTNVSGGQKQRLSIARAIASRPKICIFDDSFSALDYKTDVALRRALKEKLKDSTVIIVAQRISTILHADRIIVLDDGRIAGMGRHEELMKNCREYQEIAGSQLSEEEWKGGRG